VLHLALLEVTLASMWFIGAIMYVRLGGGK
jgi:uncharacterized membrane protein